MEQVNKDSDYLISCSLGNQIVGSSFPIRLMSLLVDQKTRKKLLRYRLYDDERNRSEMDNIQRYKRKNESSPSRKPPVFTP